VSKGAQGVIPEGMPPEIFYYGWYAESYHWPPQVVRELELEELDWLMIRQGAVSEAQRVQQQAQDRMSRASSRRGH
jgi:hypothetical protein